MVRRKVGLYLISLWLFFLLVIIITVNIPCCWGEGCHFIGFNQLITTNGIPLLCFCFLLWGGVEFKRFEFEMKGAPDIPFKIVKVESINYEHLTFLAIYIIPLVTFDFESVRYIIVLALLLIFMGIIYIKIDLFYANPTLALLGFNIYKADGLFRGNKTKENIIIITKFKLREDVGVSSINLEGRIYYGVKVME